MTVRHLAIVGLVVFGLVVAIYVHSFGRISVKSLGTCLEKKLGEQLPCFRPIVEELLVHQSPAALAQEIEKEYPRGCHSILHVIGRHIYENSANVEGALAQCPATCFSGCGHGVVAAVFSQNVGDAEGEELWHPAMDDLLAEGTRLCTGVDECHTVGHIFYQVIGSLTGALAACDVAASERELVMCYRGTFMESMQQNLPFIDGVRIPDSVYRDPERILSPCDAFPSRYSRACFHFLHINHTQTFEEKGIADAGERQRVFRAACELLPQWDRLSCFEGFGFEFYDIPVCEALSTLEDRSACMFGLSHYLTGDSDRIRRGIERCGLVREELPRRACFESAFISADTRSLLPLNEICTHESHPDCAAILARYTSDRHDLVFDPRIILPEMPLPPDPIVHSGP